MSYLYYPGLDKRKGKRLLRGRLLLTARPAAAAGATDAVPIGSRANQTDQTDQKCAGSDPGGIGKMTLIRNIHTHAFVIDFTCRRGYDVALNDKPEEG